MNQDLVSHLGLMHKGNSGLTKNMHIRAEKVRIDNHLPPHVPMIFVPGVEAYLADHHNIIILSIYFTTRLTSFFTTLSIRSMISEFDRGTKTCAILRHFLASTLRFIWTTQSSGYHIGDVNILIRKNNLYFLFIIP